MCGMKSIMDSASTSFRVTRTIALLFILNQSVFACDICGCFMGVLPYDNQSSIAFMHRYRVFNGYHSYQTQSHYFPQGAYRTMHGTTPHDSIVTRNYSSNDYESYKVFELRGKYFIHPRIEMNFFASVLNNKSKEDSVRISNTGLGDPHLFFGYHLIRPKMESNFKMRWIVGAGLKAPLGNDQARDQHSDRLPFLMQTGTGSIDYFVYTTYMMSYKKVGLTTTINYKMNGSNAFKERIDNSFTNFVSLFFKFKNKNWLFMPSVNSYYEHTNGLYVHSVKQNGTTIKELMCGAGLDIYYRNYGLSLGAQKTVMQDREEGELNSVGRIFATLSYNFNQRKYLFKGKAD
jgi:hypothetical protein